MPGDDEEEGTAPDAEEKQADGKLDGAESATKRRKC